MPRPRILEMGRVYTVYLDNWIGELLKKQAHERGISISALIREIVIEHLGKNKKPSDQPSQSAEEDPPGIDPVIRADVEDFEEEVLRLESALTNIESEVARNPYLTKPIANPLLESIRQNLMSSISNAEDKLKKLRQKYYHLRRVARGYEGLDKLAAKLYDLRKRIRDLRKQLSGRASRG